MSGSTEPLLRAQRRNAIGVSEYSSDGVIILIHSVARPCQRAPELWLDVRRKSSMIKDFLADVGADLVVATSILTVDLGLGLRTAGTLEVTSLVELAS